MKTSIRKLRGIVGERAENVYNRTEGEDSEMDAWREKNELQSLKSVTGALIAANILYFFVVTIFGQTEYTEVLIRWGAMYTPYVESGEYWRLFTAMFLHSGIRHLMNNMITLFVLGIVLEAAAGKFRFALIYLLGGIAGNIIEYFLSIRSGHPVAAVGASGAVFAVMGALIWVLLANKGSLAGMTLRRMLFMAALSVYFGFASGGTANGAHIGGLLCGFVLAVLLYRKKRVNI